MHLRLGGVGWAVDGESWAERSLARETPSPSPPFAFCRRGLRSGRGPRQPAARGQARERLAGFCVGRCGGGSAARLTAARKARNPAAASLPRRGPSSRRAWRRAGPWNKEAAAWEEEDGGRQEWRRRGDHFSGRALRGTRAGGRRGNGGEGPRWGGGGFESARPGRAWSEGAGRRGRAASRDRGAAATSPGWFLSFGGGLRMGTDLRSALARGKFPIAGRLGEIGSPWKQVLEAVSLSPRTLVSQSLNLVDVYFRGGPGLVRIPLRSVLCRDILEIISQEQTRMQPLTSSLRRSPKLTNFDSHFLLTCEGNTYIFVFISALARSESKRDGGFKNNWSFDHEEESEGDTDKDGANLLSIEEDEDSETSKGKKLNRRSEIVATSSGDFILKTYVRRNKTESFKTLKGNPIGLNMLSNNKKLSENTQNASLCSGTVVHGRRFHHANAQITLVKTAAQSSLDRKERKEYPPHVQKIEINPVRLNRPHGVERVMKKSEESSSQLEPEIKRKVQQKRHCSTYQSTSPLTPASKKCLTHLEDLQRNCRQAVTLNESAGPLLRTSIHQNSGGQKSQNTGLAINRFYGNNVGNVPRDILLTCGESRQNYLQTNGKALLSGAKITKITNLKERKTSLSDLNDPIILSSDDDDDSDRTNRRGSVSPQPADSACSSPAPSTGKVEAALNENSFRGEHELRSILADAELNTVTLPRKARMKDQFGNSIINIPLKRRKMMSQETLVDPMSLSCQSSYESVILNCRSIRVGTLFRLLVEPVIFCLDFIKIQLEEPEGDPVTFTLNTSDLTKCEFCNVRKLPVVFLQTIPAVYQKWSMQLQMNKEDKVWSECKGINKLTNLEEQYIMFLFQTSLDPQANMVFENIITEIGIKNNISNFFAKIPFEEANSRLVACTRTYEESIKGSCIQKENKVKNVSFETKIQLRNKQELQFFDDEEETGESHTIFIGPVEKLIVYPPPPAKGGISVTNEDLHCLNEGEFLNDVIIDFYLKYLVLEKLKKEDADRIHIFSSFFYKRLNQRERRNLHETTNLSIQQKRHGRVKTWTRHVDIFEKDFIFVPLNEAAHWFLAVVCFPGLEKPKYEPNPHYRENTIMQKCPAVEDSCISSPSADEMDSSSQSTSAKPVIKKMLNKKHCIAVIDSNALQEESDPRYRKNICNVKCSLKKLNHTANENEDSNKGESACQKVVDRTRSENGSPHEYLSSLHHTDGLSKIRLNYGDESSEGGKMLEDELIDFSEDQDNQDDSSDDGFLADDNCNSEIGQWHLKPTICKQPCILLMDSLRGPSRSNVVKILREYLEVEWEVKKGSKRSFSKDVMKGSNPKVPQQNNFSDCGVYVLQYVESFFENPILNFELPMNLANWFPPPRMRTKREEIQNIILKLQEDQCKEKKKHKDTYSVEAALEEGGEQYVSSISE
ncbi:PREDICTED: sentrin-specific protease 6 [Elephantulus edwardii]|uniref:sentrin-specific protease 6 n=1 Tax=Elephantulus edwardii TaxID=28737 RepID=UPI0003F093A7|nr:PREDICTED: sentrin-specific protease 6 [Elephantulus edwardii]